VRRIELKQLEYFFSVSKHLSFTKAAYELHVAQPAISQQIKYLEFALGITLFHRDNKRVSLTEAGKLLQNQAEEVLAKVDSTLKVIEEIKGLERGSVSIGMSSTMSSILMADLVDEFKKQFPEIKIRITESMTSKSIQRLKEGEIDLAIVTLPTEEDTGLEIDHLYDEDLEVIVPACHPLAINRTKSINLADLNQFEWILANNSNGLRRLINDVCSQKGFCPIVPVEVDRISSVKNLLILSQNGVSILPPTSITYELYLGLLKRVKIADATTCRSVGIASRSRQLLPPATLEMISMIKKLCNDYPQRSFLKQKEKALAVGSTGK